MLLNIIGCVLGPISWIRVIAADERTLGNCFCCHCHGLPSPCTYVFSSTSESIACSAHLATDRLLRICACGDGISFPQHSL